ncbi:MAG TPA: hypothetical protein VM285_10045 [Polyangia bacterium]|nr:hypothetical protein [Polyangia bacterium]
MEVEQTGFSLEDRVLCSDDACIGVVGPDGLCRVCGQRYQGDAPLPGSGAGSAETARDSSEAPVPGESTVASPPDAEPAWDPNERIPCADDACIGIIGRDGRCGTCGRSA